MRHLAIHVRDALAMFFARPIASVLTALALAAGLVLAALAMWLSGRVDATVSALEADLVLRASLDPALDEAQTKDVLTRVAAVPGVRSVEWVGPKAQRGELASVLGEELLEGLDDQVFPMGGLAKVTIERGPLASEAELDTLVAKVKSIAEVQGVLDVPFDVRHLRFVFAAGEAGRLVGILLAAMALLVGVLAIYLLVSAAVLARRDELDLYLALGATPRWLFARHVIYAALIGLMAAAAAIAVGLYVEGPLGRLATLLPGAGGAGPLGPPYIAWAVVGGVGLALLGGLRGLERRGLRPRGKPAEANAKGARDAR